jgi:hypothetical protein
VRDQSLGLGAYYSISHPVDPTSPLVDISSHGMGALVRYGFVLPFYSWFSVYPRMSLTYSVAERAEGIDIVTGASPLSLTEKILSASIFVPAMVHLATHFFVGIGPTVTEDIVHTNDFQRGGTSIDAPQTRRTGYGASTIIGGWL